MRNAVWLVLGLLLGVAVGVGYAWVIRPGEFLGADPATLRAEYRGDYLLLIGSAYDATGNRDRAQTRLAVFPDLDAGQLAALAQQVAAMQGSESASRGLARLSVEMLALTPTASSPSPTLEGLLEPTDSPTRTPVKTLAITIPILPTAMQHADTPSPAPAQKITFVSKEQRCEEGAASAAILVIIRDIAGAGVPGIELYLRWSGGEDRAITGMKPELGAGYADFIIETDVVYELALANSLAVIRDLKAPVCTRTAGIFPGSWVLIFEAR